MTTLNALNSHTTDATPSNLQHLWCECMVRGRVRLMAGDGEEDDDRLRPGHDPRIGLRPLVVLEVEHDAQTAFQVC
jgi:hypothetical protein